MPTKHGGKVLKKGRSSRRVSLVQSIALPDASATWTWKTFLARSRPTVVGVGVMAKLLMQRGTIIRSLPKSGAVFPINGRMRDELLNGEIFYSLREAQIIIERWRNHYNFASLRPSFYVVEENRFC